MYAWKRLSDCVNIKRISYKYRSHTHIHTCTHTLHSTDRLNTTAGPSADVAAIDPLRYRYHMHLPSTGTTVQPKTLPVGVFSHEEMDIGLHVSCVCVECRDVAGEDLFSWAGVGKRLQRFRRHAANPGCRRRMAEEG